MACIALAYIVMVCVGMALAVRAYSVMAHIGMADIAHLVMVFIVMAQVREFGRARPRHMLLDLDIESPTAGQQMTEAFGIAASCWRYDMCLNALLYVYELAEM